MTHCILCRKPTSDEPEEHIVPESLIGDLQFNFGDVRPKDARLVLSNDEVCERCNIDVTSRLDEHLQKQLAVVKPFLNRVGTKRGRSATTILPGYYARGGTTGPQLLFNATGAAINYREVSIPPSELQRKGVESSFDPEAAAIHLRYSMKFTKRFLRGLHKIAFELLCKHKGADYVLHERFDGLREYVLRGKGTRWIATQRGNIASPEMFVPKLRLEPFLNDDNWIAGINLGGWYVVDLCPESDAMRGLAHNENAKARWLLFPGKIQVPAPTT